MSAGPQYALGRSMGIGIIGAAVMFAVGIRQERAGWAGAHPIYLAAAGLPTDNVDVARRAAPHELRVPRASRPLTIDGELDEPDWTRAPARTARFVGLDGAPARPSSEARMLWDADHLYIALYAADGDVRAARAAHDGPVWTEDSFGLVLTLGDGSTRTIDVGPSGTLTDGASAPGAPIDFSWQSGAKVATDIDGTADDPSDVDEEWIVEMAVPLRALGLSGRRGERVGVVIKRCDRVEGVRSCGSFGGASAPAVLVLD